MSEVTKINTALYIRLLGRLTGYFPNFDFSFIKPVRERAAGLLELKDGDRVIDAGCGSGGSFPYLVDAVGPSGEVVGIEISPMSAASAHRRISKNKWKNAQVIESAAQTVSLTGAYDGLLMFAAADVYASDDALQNILPHLKPNARIVFFGAKVSRTLSGKILNPVLRVLFKMSFSTTPAPDHEPWLIIDKYIEKLEVKEYFFGLMFLASGTLTTNHNSHLH
jgi:SAM-dependent methyltransferase